MGCLWLALLVLVTGCPQKKATDMAEVSGKVLYQGKPLPGGTITFVNKNGPAFASGGNIDENGNYKVQAPVGEVKVSVNNAHLAPPGGMGRGKGPSAPAIKPGLKRPGSEEPNKEKGQFVPIPDKYSDPDQSGLNYTINKGSQTLEIKLE